MPDPQQPDLTNADLPWTPVSYWRAGDYDAYSLVVALKAQPELADYTDAANNSQARVRVDADQAVQGFWVTVPDTVNESVIDSALADYKPVELEQPVDPLLAALNKINLKKLSTPADVVTALRAALQPS